MGILEKKLVLKLDVHDDKAKQKAMKAVSTLPGIDSIAMDMKNMKMTVIGVADPVHIVAKLRKLCHTEIVSIGPAKEPKKEEPKKDAPKKEPAGANYEKIPDMYGTHPYMNTHHYFVYSTEEDPNAGSVMWRSSQPRHMMAGGSSGTTNRWGGGEEEMAFGIPSWDQRRGGVQYGAF